MKRKLLFSIVFFLNIGLSMFIGHELSTDVVRVDNFIVDDSEPPYGWSIITNGNSFKWVRPDGTTSLFSKESKEDAILSAWEQFEYEYEDSRSTWKPVN